MPTTTNAQLAAFLREIGTLLELDGQARSRNRNLAQAADLIEAYEDEIEEEALKANDLQLGEEPRTIALEWMNTGSCAVRNELIKTYPPGLVKIVQIPGIGASRARSLHEQLGVSSMQDLLQAGLRGELTQIKGIGKKSADNILSAVREHLGEDGTPAPKPEEPSPAPPKRGATPPSFTAAAPQLP